MPSQALTDLIRLLTARPRPAQPTVQDLRLGFDILGSKLPPSDDIVSTAVHVGDIAVEWVEAPEAAADRAIL